MWKNSGGSRGLVSPAHLNTLLFMTLDSCVSAPTRTSPAVWVQQEPLRPDWLTSGHVLRPEKGKEHSRSVTTARFRVNAERGGMTWACKYRQEGKKEADFVRKALCASAWEGWSTFPPTSPPRNNHSGDVAAKAAALIEETVTSCDAAAYT